MIAEEKISNLSVVSPGEYGSVAHCAVKTSSLDNLRYVHSIVPDILLDVDDDFESVLHRWYRHIQPTIVRIPVFIDAEVLRYLLRHCCPSLFIHCCLQ